MSYPRIFYFEPPKRFDPDWRSTIYGEIVPRALEIVSHRSQVQLEYGVSTLNYLFSTALSELISDYDSNSFARVESQSSYLRKLMPRISIVEQGSLPNAAWPEYFAILALSLSGRAFETFEIVADGWTRHVTIDPPRVSSHPDTAAQSMEALAVGESLLSLKSRVTETAEATIQLAKSEAAIRGHQHRYDLWDLMSEYYLANQELSKAEAIRRFFAQLSNDDQKVLCRVPDNMEQVVETLRPKLKGL